MTTEERMLAKAEADQVVAQQMGDGRFVTRSLIHPNPTPYFTTATSCGCQGFQRHGYCKHVAYVRSLVSRKAA